MSSSKRLRKAEQLAAAAEDLPAFGGIKVVHIKRQLTEMLTLFGRDGIFDEYTKHDITHVDAMLDMLDWLIPPVTQTQMSPADWLLLVLSIYFHDIGLLVTKEEFEARAKSGFPEFKERILFAGKDGEDYRGNVEHHIADPLARERFFYQEFVRNRHAERVRAWIMGTASDQLGVPTKLRAEVQELLSPLDEIFRRDLATVCESHHLEDLHDTRKYKPSQPYGNSEEETANVQYAAILLRTADLLHITQDRTPAVLFRLINPADPISQREWAKQRSVKRVRPAGGASEDGAEMRQLDTVEVHAYFKDANGFFGLNSYLHYAREQLRKCGEWAEIAKKVVGPGFEFPWRDIDDSNIETSGFLTSQFEFELDRTRILGLLTGHTLYNDTTVVLRELIQNSLDAIRLRSHIDGVESRESAPGSLRVHWDSHAQVITVIDNGTGMSQHIIEHHLLRVGSSRYQDPEFKKTYPGFYPISRFGIGILSCFMVADEVEITTVSSDDPEGRLLTLRSVHGKYLIRLLEKTAGELADIGSHGTRIRLRLRRSAKLDDVLDTVRHWVLFPSCSVIVAEDDAEPVDVGFPGPRHALIATLRNLGFEVEAAGSTPPRDRSVRVLQKSSGAVTLAYAVQWSEYFREWSFLELSRRSQQQVDAIVLGSAIEGIRVDPDTPGYKGKGLAAMANFSGPLAPRTNVARSAMENTAEFEQAIQTVYSLYCDHVREETVRLQEERKFSLSWATEEAQFLLTPLLEGPRGRGQPREALRLERLTQEIGGLPLLLVEHLGERKAVSPTFLTSASYFWTVNWEFLRSAERLVKEIPTSVSVSKLMDVLHAGAYSLPQEPVLASGYRYRQIAALVFSGKHVDRIDVWKDQRRVDLRWGVISGELQWISLLPLLASTGFGSGLFDSIEAFDLDFRDSHDAVEYSLVVGQGVLAVNGADDLLGVRVHGITYLFPGTEVAEFAYRWVHLGLNAPDVRDQRAAVFVVGRITAALNSASEKPDTQRLRQAARRMEVEDHPDLDFEILTVILKAAVGRVLDPSAWLRTSMEV